MSYYNAIRSSFTEFVDCNYCICRLYECCVEFDVVCLVVQLPPFRNDTSPSHGYATQQSSVAPAKKSGLLYSSSLPRRRSCLLLFSLTAHM